MINVVDVMQCQRFTTRRRVPVPRQMTSAASSPLYLKVLYMIQYGARLSEANVS